MTLQLYNPDDVRPSPLLDLGVPTDSHSDEFVGAQSARLHVSLKEKSPGIPELSSLMSSGNDEAYRQLLADTDTLNQYKNQSRVLQSLTEVDPKLVTPEIVGVVQGLSQMELKSPDLNSIVEKKYADVYANTVAATMENGVMEEAIQENPDETLETLDRLSLFTFKQNYVNKKLDTTKEAVQGQGWGMTAWNFADNMLFGEYQQMDVAEEGVSDQSILPGNDRLDQYAFLYGLEDQDEFVRQIDIAMEEIQNPYSRQQWLEGFYSYGNLDATLNNAFAVVDAVDLTPIGILKNAMKSAAKGALVSPTNIPKLAETVGKNGEAAVAQVIQDLGEGNFFKQNIRNMAELEKSVPSITSPLTMLEGSQNLSQASMLRLKEALMARSDLAQKFLVEPNLVDRATPEELAGYKDILLDEYVKNNPSIQKNVIDVSIDGADIGNVYRARVSLGRRDGTLFESRKQAEGYFKRYIGGTNDYEVTQIGQGFRIDVLKNVDETKIASDIRLGTIQRTPESLANTFASGLRSADYTVSRQTDLQRSVVVTSKEVMDDIFSEIAQPLDHLGKKELTELEDLMVVNRQKQQYFTNYGELEAAFWARFKKPPTEAQVDAYNAYVQINDLDLVVRDLDWYKQKARMGIEEVGLTIDGEKLSFEGKLVESLPYGDTDYFSVSLIKNGKAEKPIGSNFLGESKRTEINKLIEQGYKIIQGYDGIKLGDTTANFVVVKDVTRNRIGVKNIDRKAGGHKVHKYPFYIKQGKFTSNGALNLYGGDTTLFNIRSMKEGKEVIELLEKARLKHLRNEPDAMVFVRDNLPMISTQAWSRGVKDGTINLNIPFSLTMSGQRALDTGAYSSLKNVKDMMSNKHNLSSQVTGRFRGERSETNIDVIKSEGDTKFEIEGAPYLSPMQTLQMSSSNMLSTRLMNDHTISVLQNFKREFGDILQGTPEEINASGLDILVNPQFKEGIEGTQAARAAAAKNVSRAYQNLLNMGTSLDKQIDYYKEQLISSIIPRVSSGRAQWLEEKMLNRAPDPGSYLRSFAFTTKLGMFNPVQYFVQANGVVNVTSIAGTKGFRGAVMYPFLRAALLTKDVKNIEAIAKKVNAVGLMKPDEFVESLSLLKKSGWNNLGGDIAYLDDIKSPELVKGDVRKAGSAVLSWGRTPFNEGERVVRLAAWQAAYLERKEALMGRKITRYDEAAILKRAKDLTGNMTRESNAPYQKGYAAVMTQFMGYQARIMEQFLGKKLTRAEKARLFTGYSMVYGLPVAAGATTGIIPVRDILRDQLAANGVEVDGTPWEVAIDGFAQSMSEYMFGTELNVAERYGPGGLPTFYDFWREDSTFSDLLLGAGGGIALDTIASSYPAIRGMMSEFADFEGGMYNTTPEDFIKPLRNISTVDNAVKLWQVYNTGVWMSKNGANITEMDLPEGVIAALTGLQPARIEDAFTKLDATKEIKEFKERAFKTSIDAFRRAMKMERGSEYDSVIRSIKAESRMNGMSEKDLARAWKYASNNEMMTDTFFKRYEEAIEDFYRNRKAEEE